MIRNIEDKFLAAGEDCFIDSDWGRIYLTTENPKLGIQLLTKIFGISSVSPVVDSTDDLDEITKTVVDYTGKLFENNIPTSFAMRTRRLGNHGYTSMDLAKHLGKVILDTYPGKNLKVNLTNPEVELFVEVRRKQSFIFSESYTGPGGLPLGTQGKVISIFSDESSYIASWLMMKRGCRVYPVAFSTTADETKNIEQNYYTQIELLKPWAANLKLKSFEVDDKKGFEDPGFIKFARWVKAIGICSSLRSLDGIQALIGSTNGLPMFYPLIGLNDDKIQELEEKIKTTKLKY
jgi:thiamine biosynthesis protein ThiI